jgi:imidazolonepropionase-like amidohydrolase
MKQMLFTFLIFLSLCFDCAAQQTEPTIAFTNATVIDMTKEKSQRAMTVVINGNRILQIGRHNRVKIPYGAKIVDATGKFLIPGLWDMHVHFWDANVFYPIALANGVTGVRDMGDDLKSLVAYRNQSRNGTRLAPGLYFSGQIIDHFRRENLPFLFDYAETPENARELVRRRKSNGADFVKIYSYLTPEIFEAVADESKLQKIPFAGHVPIAVGALRAALAGQRSFEHLTGVALSCADDENERTRRANEMLSEIRKLDSQRSAAVGNRAQELTQQAFNLSGQVRRLAHEEALDVYDSRKAEKLFAVFRHNKTWQVPTLSVGGGNALSPDTDKQAAERLQYFPNFVRGLIRQPEDVAPARLAQSKKRFEVMLQIVRQMHRAKVPILAGSDAPNPNSYPGFSLHDELVFLVRAGLSPFESLATATRNAAEFMGKLNETGTIEPGKLADLVLLDADPLADIRNTRKIRAVVTSGRLLERADLDRMLAEAARKYAAQTK